MNHGECYLNKGEYALKESVIKPRAPPRAVARSIYNGERDILEKLSFNFPICRSRGFDRLALAESGVAVFIFEQHFSLFKVKSTKMALINLIRTLSRCEIFQRERRREKHIYNVLGSKDVAFQFFVYAFSSDFKASVEEKGKRVSKRSARREKRFWIQISVRLEAIAWRDATWGVTYRRSNERRGGVAGVKCESREGCCER